MNNITKWDDFLNEEKNLGLAYEWEALNRTGTVRAKNIKEALIKAIEDLYEDLEDDDMARIDILVKKQKSNKNNMENFKLIEDIDLIEYAEEIGYDYNQACDLIGNYSRAKIKTGLATCEFRSQYFKITDFVSSKYSEDLIKICKGFMKKENITEMEVVNV